jgi:hypothetical protein
VLDEKVAWKPERRRLDKTIAVLTACTSVIMPKQAAKRDARSIVLWKLIEATSEFAADVAVPSAQALMNEGLVNGSTKSLGKIWPTLSATQGVSR